MQYKVQNATNIQMLNLLLYQYSNVEQEYLCYSPVKK